MYRKNTAGQFVCFQGVDATTGGIKSGVTWTVRRCIDGTFAAGGGTVTEDSTNGWYKYAMSQADTNGNDVSFNFTGTGAVPQTVNIVTTAADPTDAVHFGLSALPNTAVTTNASLLTSGTGTDQLSVSAGKVLLQATQAGVTIPTVTTVTNQLTAAQIATGVWTDTTAGDFTVALSVGKSILNGVSLGTGLTVNALTTNNDKTGYSLAVAPPTAGAIATAVWQDSTAGDFTAASSIGKSLYTSGNAPGAASGLALVGSNMGSVSSVTGAVGSVTGNVGGNVFGTVASVTGNVGGNVTGSVGSVVGGIGGSVAGSVASVMGNVGGNVVGSVGSVTNPVTVGTNNDKTDYTLTIAYDPAKTAAQQTDLLFVRNILEGDETIDTTVNPWNKVIKIKQTGTELVRKILRDVTGAGIGATTTVIGRSTDL